MRPRNKVSGKAKQIKVKETESWTRKWLYFNSKLLSQFTIYKHNNMQINIPHIHSATLTQLVHDLLDSLQLPKKKRKSWF